MKSARRAVAHAAVISGFLWSLLSFSAFSLKHRINPFTAKSTATNMAETIDKIANEFSLGFDALPTTDDIAQEIATDNVEEMSQLDQRLDAARRKPLYLCPGPKYTRDYTSLCPQGWLLQANGSCWGRSYRGPCDSMHYFGGFSESRKMNFEHNCCAYWPKKSEAKIYPRPSIPHGPVESITGSIIRPTLL